MYGSDVCNDESTLPAHRVVKGDHVPGARYRNQFMTEGLSKELEYCQQAVQPLLGALQRTIAALPAAAGGESARLRLLLSSARLACRVFYSLNSPGLTEASRSPSSPAGKWPANLLPGVPTAVILLKERQRGRLENLSTGQAMCSV